MQVKDEANAACINQTLQKGKKKNGTFYELYCNNEHTTTCQKTNLQEAVFMKFDK